MASQRFAVKLVTGTSVDKIEQLMENIKTI